MLSSMQIFSRTSSAFFINLSASAVRNRPHAAFLWPPNSELAKPFSSILHISLKSCGLSLDVKRSDIFVNSESLLDRVMTIDFGLRLSVLANIELKVPMIVEGIASRAFKIVYPSLWIKSAVPRFSSSHLKAESSLYWYSNKSFTALPLDSKSPRQQATPSEVWPSLPAALRTVANSLASLNWEPLSSDLIM